MVLSGIDLAIVVGYLLMTLAVGFIASRGAGKDTSSFFLSGRSMPWWLLGFSMVATTFSTDTPNLVTGIVREHGVSGNWMWWSFLLTGMLTVFVYAKLWNRSGVLTDVEFYEIRYSGREAAFLRGFRALYLGLFFNTLVMATVTVAAIKIGSVMLGVSPLMVILVAGGITVLFSATGGLKAVLWTDAILFVVAMTGSVCAAYIAVNHEKVGGLGNLLAHENVAGRLSLLPDFQNHWDKAVAIFLIPIAVQWWSVWYPGAEPGGGGYVAQRILAAKSERHAIGATLFFNVAHYALRPWPWILVALASLVVFPDVASLREAFPNVPETYIREDIAYPAMLTFLPTGLLGLVVASLAAAYMSTISTQMNWGSSYITNDFWKRFVSRDAAERELVKVGRVATVLTMVLASLLALTLRDAVEGFNLMLQVGAGTGLLLILRWFWWRINAWSEITAMAVSFLVAVCLYVWKRVAGEAFPLNDWQQFLAVMVTTTICWIAVTLLTPMTDLEVLKRFYRLTEPGGPGWEKVDKAARPQGDELTPSGGAAWDVPLGILMMLVGTVAVYAALFATGEWLYGRTASALTLTVVAAVAAGTLLVLWGNMRTRGSTTDQ